MAVLYISGRDGFFLEEGWVILGKLVGVGIKMVFIGGRWGRVCGGYWLGFRG